jgi:hypothetical protein
MAVAVEQVVMPQQHQQLAVVVVAQVIINQAPQALLGKDFQAVAVEPLVLVAVEVAQAALALWVMPQLAVEMVVQDCHLTSAVKHNITVEVVEPFQEWTTVLAALVALAAADFTYSLLFHTAVAVAVAMSIHKLTLIQY